MFLGSFIYLLKKLALLNQRNIKF
ncbi:MAG: hypothetical protein ACFFA6_13440 [Promethearchaeota archaeon]